MEMREAAEQYCFLVEQAESMGRERFAALLAESLAALLWAAARASPRFTDMNDLPRLSDEQWRERYRAIQGVLGDWHLYATTVEPLGEGATQVGMVPLADDLADIWRDLKPGLVALGEGAPPEGVAWEWRFGFYAHWGRHATEALRAIHARVAEAGGPA